VNNIDGNGSGHSSEMLTAVYQRSKNGACEGDRVGPLRRADEADK
jgi:hypothetical protein